MSSKTKIVVLKMKELIYTAIFIGLGLLFIILLIYMFFPSGESDSVSSSVPTATLANENIRDFAADDGAIYVPGVYTASMILSGQNVDIAVSVDADHINAIQFRQLNAAVTTMLPLLEPSLQMLEAQIRETQSLENINLAQDSPHTSRALLNTIETALNKALIENH